MKDAPDSHVGPPVSVAEIAGTKTTLFERDGYLHLQVEHKEYPVFVRLTNDTMLAIKWCLDNYRPVQIPCPSLGDSA